MIDLDFKLSGDLTAGLDKFEARIKQRVLFVGAAAGARVIYDELKQNTSGARMHKAEASFVGPSQPSAPGKKTSHLHDAVYRTFSKSRSSDGVQTYHVGVNKRKAPHWHLIEFGHFQPYRAVLTKRGWITLRNKKHNRQFIPGHPYLRPSLSALGRAIEAAKERMGQAIEEGGA